MKIVAAANTTSPTLPYFIVTELSQFIILINRIF